MCVHTADYIDSTATDQQPQWRVLGDMAVEEGIMTEADCMQMITDNIYRDRLLQVITIKAKVTLSGKKERITECADNEGRHVNIQGPKVASGGDN